MVAQPQHYYITPMEYLERERNAEFKSEYDDGVILAMAGSSPEHAAITFNFGAELQPHLRRAGCRGFSPDLRVRVEAGNRYYYPDLTVVCGEPEFDEAVTGMQSLRNPTLILEVLSPSTERQDRGRKWLAYQGLASLSTYVLAHQDRPCVEVYSRNPDTQVWEYRKVEGLEAALELPAFACNLALAQIYTDAE